MGRKPLRPLTRNKVPVLPKPPTIEAILSLAETFYTFVTKV